MRVYVTGAQGFVGRRLCARLAREGAAVTGIDRELDVSDAPRLAASLAAARPEAVVHLAALSSVPDSSRTPQATWRVNFLGTRSVLEALRQHAPRARLLVVSSGQVYGAGQPGAPGFTETAALRPGSPYAWSKAAAERLAAAHAARGADVVVARPFNHSGPGRPEHFVESSLARQLAERARGLAAGPLAVGNLEAVRDFLDVDDVVEAYLRLLDPGVPAGVYNVSSGSGRRVADVLDALCAAAGLRPELAIDPARWRPADLSVGSAERLRRITGWEPKIPFEATLQRLLETWQQQLGAA